MKTVAQRVTEILLSGDSDWSDQIDAILHGEDRAMVCPQVCPQCGVNLQSDGYPLEHKTDEGDLCVFRWES